MLCVSVSDALSELVAMEPLASIAVIVRNFEQSKRFFKIFTDVPKVRLVVDGEFEFVPGVDIVSVSEVKGLEFDYVIIPDASNIFYPDTPESRRSLHVASTRAIHQLWLLASSEWSSTIPERYLGKL
jgi:DNA helicase-2/ATP-dependent DNA helicase PcrA